MEHSKLYWVSAIIQNWNDRKAWLCPMSEGVFSLDEALEVIQRLKDNNYNVLVAWIDETDENNNKKVVFHECYIDMFGNTRR